MVQSVQVAQGCQLSGRSDPTNHCIRDVARYKPFEALAKHVLAPSVFADRAMKQAPALTECVLFGASLIVVSTGRLWSH